MNDVPIEPVSSQSWGESGLPQRPPEWGSLGITPPDQIDWGESGPPPPPPVLSRGTAHTPLLTGNIMENSRIADEENLQQLYADVGVVENVLNDLQIRDVQNIDNRRSEIRNAMENNPEFRNIMQNDRRRSAVEIYLGVLLPHGGKRGVRRTKHIRTKHRRTKHRRTKHRRMKHRRTARRYRK